MLTKYLQNIFFILFLINITPSCFTAAGIPEPEYDPMLPIEEEEGETTESAYYGQNRPIESDDELNSAVAKILSQKSNLDILSSPELLFPLSLEMLNLSPLGTFSQRKPRKRMSSSSPQKFFQDPILLK